LIGSFDCGLVFKREFETMAIREISVKDNFLQILNRQGKLIQVT